MDEKELENRREMTTAALYPLFVMALGAISMVIIVTWVIPRIVNTLGADLSAMPAPTRFMMHLGQWLQQYGPVAIIAVLAGLWLIKAARATRSGAYWYDRILLSTPIVGHMQYRWIMARFARTLGTILKGHVPILQAMAIVRNALGNAAVAAKVDQMTHRIRSGTDLASAMAQSGIFPPLLIEVAALGQESGKLDGQLLRLAGSLELQTARQTQRFMTIFPAVMIVILAVIVGGIVAATLLPVVQMQTSLPLYH